MRFDQKVNQIHIQWWAVPCTCVSAHCLEEVSREWWTKMEDDGTEVRVELLAEVTALCTRSSTENRT